MLNHGAVDLYLMQHGEAVQEQDDPQRPLTADGRADVHRVAAVAWAAGVRLGVCFHSGKLRAKQSAELLATALDGARVETMDGLAPNDKVAPVARWLRDREDSAVAVVGHLPSLGRLASLLLAGDETAGVVAFHMGGLVRLVPQGPGETYAVDWALTPAVCPPS